MICFWSHGKAKYLLLFLVVYSQSCTVSSSTAKCEGKMADGKTLLLCGGKKQPHGATEPDTVTKEPGCITAMYCGSEKFK